MIKTYNTLLKELQDYKAPNNKISRMVRNGIITPIIKGLYETNENTPGYLLANIIYGPSYLSFDFALSYYGLIPEAVYTFTSATFEKKKEKIGMPCVCDLYINRGSGCRLVPFLPLIG